MVTRTSPNIMGGIAEGLAEEGPDIFCVDINPEYAAACARSVVAAIERSREAFGGVGVLVNGAAIFNYRSVLDMVVAEWRRQTDVILTGAFCLPSTLPSR